MAKTKISGSSGSKAPASTGDVFPVRPAFGTQGKPIILWANYFRVNVNGGSALYKYSLKATWKGKASPDGGEPIKEKGDKKVPDPKGRKLHNILGSALKQVAKPGQYATEFKDQVITREALQLPPSKTVLVTYDVEGRGDVFEVLFDGPTNVDIPGLLAYLRTGKDPTGDVSFPKYIEQVDAISVIAGHHARSNACREKGHADLASLGRSRYFPLNIQEELKELYGPEYNRIIRGYFQSPRLATGRLLLNANVSHGVFRPKGKVSDLYEGGFNLYDLHKALAKLKCRVKVLSEDKNPQNFKVHERTIHGLADPKKDARGKDPPKIKQFGADAANVLFYLKSPAPAGLKANAYCSVKEYYKKRYGYDVKPEYPVVNIGGQSKPIYMPAELVEVLDGQAVKRKTTPNETRDMILFSCRSPYANATSIATLGRKVLGLDGSDTLKAFGLQVDKQLLTVQGRELPPPTVVYRDNKTAIVRDGEWNMESVKVYRPGVRIDRWFWISVRDPRGYTLRVNEVHDHMGAWIDFMQRQGIAIATAALPMRPQDCEVAIEDVEALFKYMKAKDPQFVFVVLPGKKTDTDKYNKIKQLCDRTFGYRSQAVLSDNLRKSNPQLYANLGLKVNLKMGGVNHKLREDVTIVKNEHTMLVGYDVTHPTNLAGDIRGVPSLVGMVASIDKELSQWPGTAWAQSGKVEMLGDELKERFAGRLRLYRRHNQDNLPVNIIIFRDGVSEGQFSQVIDQELPRIRQACQQMYPANAPPKITLIVSVKRHQTRFYPTNSNNTVKSRNIKNGTVVDRGVTQATTWDFFLTAHKGLQGTSRPAHYTVLLDEVFRSKSAQDAANMLEKLTFETCHLFGRATKAVSICPPAYYADILCTRARVYLADKFERADTETVTSGKSGSRSEESVVENIDVHPNLADAMFYI
ncbi:ribonuclease H-like domain-containing protein [Poronia punctata]|nr:ribonuclease H-like domain-containing protein [Poronia punctata]